MRQRSVLVALLTVAVLLVADLPGPGPAAAEGNEAPGGPSAFRSIAAGNQHTCAILDNGAVTCWGEGSLGRLGSGDEDARGDDPGEMGTALPTVDLGDGRTATAVATGSVHTCAILDNGQLKCWGRNNHGQLGLGDTEDRGDQAGEMGDDLDAVDLGPNRTATAVTVGDSHTCAILDTGQVKCWGRNNLGKLGLGDTATRGDGPGEMAALPAVDLGPGRTATAVTAGSVHTCAVLDNGQLKCWGSGANGRLGYGDTTTRGDEPHEMGAALPAVEVGAGRRATAVTVGDLFSCALLDDGTVKCWGFGLSGRLGQGDISDRGDGPDEMGDDLPAVDLGAGRTAVAVTVGSGHTCVRLDDASVKCWGFGASGRLGYGDTTTRGDEPHEMGVALPAVELGAGRTAVAVTVGSGHSCALLDTGRLKCWGQGGNGRLGQGDTTDRGDGPDEMGDDLPAIDLTRVVGVGALVRPDGHIRRGTGPFVGNNRYNTTGANQTRVAKVAPRGQARFTIRIQNDGTYTDRFRVKAKANSPRYTVTYRRGPNNITNQVRGAGFTTPQIRPGQTLNLTVTIKAKPNARRGNRIERLLTITSRTDTTRKDAVRARVTRR